MKIKKFTVFMLAVIALLSWSVVITAGADSDTASLAQQILNHPDISYLTVQVSGVKDSANAYQNLKDLADGKEAARSSYGNAPGGYTAVDARVLQALISIADKYGKIRITAIAGGSHSKGSAHYSGLAVDLDTLGGKRINNNNATNFTQAEMNSFKSYAVKELGAADVIFPNDPGGSVGCLHIDWKAAITTLNPPSNFIITQIDASSAKLSWDAVAEAAYYEVQWCSSGSSNWNVSTDYKTKTATSYVSYGMKQITYTFRVRAVNSGGVSDWAESSIAMQPKDNVILPSAPTNLSAVKISSGNAKISWTAVTGAASYEVEWSTANSNGWQTSNDYKDMTATSYVSTGMGKIVFSFRVRAVNAAGKSDWTTCTVDMR